MIDKSHPREPRTDGHPLCRNDRNAGLTPEFCPEAGKVEVDGLLLCQGHALQARLEGQIDCWEEMLFHVHLWIKEASRRERPDIVRLLEGERAEVERAMNRARANLGRARGMTPRGFLGSELVP